MRPVLLLLACCCAAALLPGGAAQATATLTGAKQARLGLLGTGRGLGRARVGCLGGAIATTAYR